MIYLDNNATTPLDPRVLDVMMPFLTTEYANPASNHSFGVALNQHIKNARNNIAELLNCDSSEIIFTSGATEAINLAIKGLAIEYKSKGKHIITVSTEHPAVLDTCKYLEENGFTVTYLPVREDGIIDLQKLKTAIQCDTVLISVMFVNNETGVIQPIKEIASIAHENNIFFMTDATQAIGKIPVDVKELDIDLLAFSGHKFYGPKGIGGLYVRGKRPFKIKLPALIHGGGHERGMRSGTLNVPAIVGLGEAARLAKVEMQKDATQVQKLRDSLEKELLTITNSYINGNKEKRLYNVTNICFEGADADAVMAGLKHVILSNGSACTSSKTEPSHVLIEMGLNSDQSYSSIRLSLNKYNTSQELTVAISELKELIDNLRVLNK